MESPPVPDYFTLADSEYFLGAVALVNSLAVTGNCGRMTVIDIGLEDWQRDLLSPSVVVKSLDETSGLLPTFYKSNAGGTIEADLLVYIDSDIIVTDSLSDVLAQAAAGRICAAPDGQPQRFFPEWGELMPLTAPLRRQPYVNAGFLALAPATWPTFFGRWQELCEELLEHSPPMHTISFEEALVTPAGWHDQDALNAMLMSEVRADGPWLIDDGLVAASAEMTGVECIDPASLECRLEGRRLLFLHYLNGPKPWQRSGWIATSDNAYVRLLSRLLRGDDVPIRIADKELPVWLREEEGLRRAAILAGIRGVRKSSHVVPSSLRRRVRAFLSRR